MLIEFGATAEYDVFATVEVPDGVSAADFARSPEGQEALRVSFTEYWENTSIKFRDAHVVITDGTIAGEETSEVWDEIVELK